MARDSPSRSKDDSETHGAHSDPLDREAQNAGDGGAVSVTVYSREHCHLCEEAVATLEEAASAVDVPVDVDLLDVDDDPQLREKYGERVPYVTIAGRPAFKFRVDPERARRRLREAAAE